MDRKDQKTAEAAENQVEAPAAIEDNDLDAVTGGLSSGFGVAKPADPACITFAP